MPSVLTKEKVLKLIQGRILEPFWNKVGIHHHIGVNLPLSSLRSEESCGIGEYLDLLKMIDFCKDVGFNILQLLPLNDSSFDPSPYNAMSSLALHPIYLSLYALPFLDQFQELKSALSFFKPFLSTDLVHYSEVLEHKMQWLRKYYALTSPMFEKDEAYQTFLQSHPWITTYALYKTLREEIYKKPLSEWDDDIRKPQKDLLHSLISTYQESIQFYSLLQYLCHLQLLKVKLYAEKNQLLLKGDIPILLSADSVDMWLHSQYFDTHYAVGTPPDDYNHEGQNWGFPAFNWDEMKKDHYSWWKERLQASSDYYHLYRIDHTVGFYRLWLIPPGATAKEGFFKPSQLEKALEFGHEILPLLVSFSEMMPLAEDLGMIPPEVFISLHSMAIPGTKVIRWMKHFNPHDHHFHYYPYHHYYPLNLTCVSTHDSATLQGWWEGFPKEAIDFCTFKGWVYDPVLSDDYRYQILEDSIKCPTLFHINLLQEYLGLCKELIRDRASEERINVPGFYLPTNWTYRFLPTIEAMNSHEELKRKIRKLLSCQPKELP